MEIITFNIKIPTYLSFKYNIKGSLNFKIYYNNIIIIIKSNIFKYNNII